MDLETAAFFILVAEFTFYLFHFAFGYYFVKKMMAVSLMHPNLRLLMCNIIVEYTLVGVGRIGNYCLRRFDVNDAVICAFFRIVSDTGILMAGLTFVWISLERLMATVLIRTYELKTSSVAKKILLLAYMFTFLASASGVMYDAVFTNNFASEWTGACETHYLHPEMLPIFVLLAVANYLFVLTLLACLYRYNRRRKEVISAPLSARYQYAENVATLAILLPSVLMWGVIVLCCLPLVGWCYVAWLADDVTTERFTNQGVYLLAAMNSIICPLAFVFKYAPLSRAFRADIHALLCKPNKTVCSSSMAAIKRPVLKEADYHFQQLRDMWDNAVA